MARREFATQKTFHDYAERTGQAYLWEGTPHLPNVSGCYRPINTRLWMYARPVV
jgi:hypothetical protein